MTAAPLPLRLADPILVVGGFGYRNIGDEAILAGLLRSMGGKRVTVLSRLPAETAAMHGVRAVPMTSAVAELRRHRTIVIGGGGLFGTDMGGLGRLLPGYGLSAIALGRTVVLHGVGLDPDLRPPSALAVRQLARHATSVLVRDEVSAEVLQGWGVEAAVGPDLSAWLSPASRAAGATALRAAGLDPRRPIVGLALTAVRAELVPEVLAAAVGTMEALPDLQFVFLPMSQHPFVAAHHDGLLGRRLQVRQPRLRVLSTTDPATMLAVYGHLSAVVGMRYHSLVFAARAGVPLLAVPYAAKCRAWLAEREEVPVEPSASAWVARLQTVVPAAEAVS